MFWIRFLFACKTGLDLEGGVLNLELGTDVRPELSTKPEKT